MKAAVQFEVPGSVESWMSDDRPRSHEVLIRTIASGLCHSDLHFLEGKYIHPVPVVLGHEAAGIVEEVGDAVTGIKAGDHVVTCLSILRVVRVLFERPARALHTGRCGRGADDETPRLSLDGALVHPFARLGAFAEKMLVHEHSVVTIRPDMPFDPAALLGCAVVTGIGAVTNTAGMRTGSTVAVIGCGGIGLNAVQGASIAGASRIVAIDKLAWKLELARNFGATDLVDAAEEDPVAAVRTLIAGGVDYAFEAIGLKSTAEQAFPMLRQSGTATVIGMIPARSKIEVEGQDLVFSEKKLRGSHMGSNRFRIDIPLYIDLYLAGRLNLDDLVSARISWMECERGISRLSLVTHAERDDVRSRSGSASRCKMIGDDFSQRV